MFSSLWVLIFVLFFNYGFSNPQQLECGMENIGKGILIGGKASKSLVSTWKIAVYRNDSNSEFVYKCGGVLINQDTAVTGEKYELK